MELISHSIKKTGADESRNSISKLLSQRERLAFNYGLHRRETRDYHERRRVETFKSRSKSATRLFTQTAIFQQAH